MVRRLGSPNPSVSNRRPWLLIAICGVALQEPALASFHFMQIEQVIGGVNGDAAAQAIQLRMRVNEQNRVSIGRLYARDAAGANPVLLIDFTTDVSVSSLGSRVLAATAQFATYTEPVVEPDFVLLSPIPSAYLAAGSLTFENDDGTLLVWRLSWGGSGYSGSTTGAFTNDDDGEFGPPFAGSLPSDGLSALRFQGASTAKSTSNLADYLVTDGEAVFTNNAGQAFTVIPLNCPNDPDNDIDNDGVCGDVDNCPQDSNDDQADRDEDGVGDACDGCPDNADISAADCNGGGDPPPDNGNDNTGGEPPIDNNNDNTTGGGGTTGPTPRACGAGMLTFAPLLFLGLVLGIVHGRARGLAKKL